MQGYSGYNGYSGYGGYGGPSIDPLSLSSQAQVSIKYAYVVTFTFPHLTYYYTFQPPYGSSSPPATSTSTHPRDYIRAHKAGLEAWDDAVWNEALNSLEALRLAWDQRREEVGRALSTGAGSSSSSGLDQVHKRAIHNIGLSSRLIT